MMEKINSILAEAIISDFGNMLDNSKKPYALSLVCNDGMDNFFLALADSEDLNHLISENEARENEDFLYYKWSPNEWLNMSYQLENSCLKEFNRKINRDESMDRSDFNAYRKSMFDTCISSLIAAKPGIEAKLEDKNIPIFISFTDISNLEEIQNYSADKINSSAVYETFKNRFAELSWGKNLDRHYPFK
jgi:hypothetical protein